MRCFIYRNKNLSKLIFHLNNNSIPEEWYDASDRIRKDSNHLDKILNRKDSPSIYGVNKLVGHLDHVDIKENDIDLFQEYLIDNHMIGSGKENYSYFESKCISYLKMHDFSIGGSAITPELYNNIVYALENDLLDMNNIPKSSSYSCGDVIPGSHWAKNVLNLLDSHFSYKLKRKEGLSLINGSFMHTGISVSKIIDIQPVWALYNYNSLKYIEIMDIKRSNFSQHLTTNSNDTILKPLKWSRLKSRNKNENNIQEPISIRSYPQISSSFMNSILLFSNSIEEQLERRSDNPIIVHEEKDSISQASMMAPMISLSTGQLIESMLLAMWQIERRVHFLISGSVKDIPENASTSDDPLGLIQVPKLISAILEETRYKAGRRTFASGSSTSYGIEDIWTNGLMTLETLGLVSDNMNRILSIELSVILKIQSFIKNKIKIKDEFDKYKEYKTIREMYMSIEEDNLKHKLPILYDLKPFEYQFKNI